ncbi:MAG: YIP1 family protein [Acidobacteria bacterium]|nr:YIP1 family protein [Acidobacteriota bacterium]
MMAEDPDFHLSGAAGERMGLAPRFSALFFSPGRLFHSLNHRPVWLVTVLVVAALLGLMNLGFTSSETGQDLAREGIREAFRDRDIPIDENLLDQQILIQRIAAPIAPFLFLPIITLFLAAILYLVFNVFLGGDGTFRKVLAVCGHSFIIGIPQSLLTLALIYMKHSLHANTSFAVFLPFLGTETLAYKILRGIDLFYLWQIGLITLGVSIIYRLPTKKCGTILFGIYFTAIVAIALIRQALQ